MSKSEVSNTIWRKTALIYPDISPKKKSHNTAMAVALAKVNPKILLGGFSLN